MGRSAGVAEGLALAALAALGSCASSTSVGRASPEFETCDDPDGAAAFARAESLIEAGRPGAAVPELLVTVDRCPDFVLGHMRYQDVAREVGGTAENEMRAFYASLGDRPPSPVVPFVLARISDEPAEQLPLLDQAIERDRSFYLAYLDKARILRSIHRTVEALDLLQLAVTCQPQCPDSNLLLAEILVGLGRAREAARHYAAYVELVPGDLDAKREYLQLLVYSLGRLDEAVELTDDLLAVDGEDVLVLMDRAAIAWQRGDHGDARTLYHRVLELDPTRDRAVLNLANLYYDVLPGGTDDGRREYWPKARAAYRYFLRMRRAEGLFDSLDYHIGVPKRLAEIARMLGPAPGRAPSIRDF